MLCRGGWSSARRQQRRRRGGRGRGSAPSPRAAADGNDLFGAAAKFLKKARAELPVVGLVARLTSADGDYEVDVRKLSYAEFCRNQYEGKDAKYFIALDDLVAAHPPPRPDGRNALLFVLWAVATGGGLVAEDTLMRAARRVRIRGCDIEWETYNMQQEREKAPRAAEMAGAEEKAGLARAALLAVLFGEAEPTLDASDEANLALVCQDVSVA